MAFVTTNQKRFKANSNPILAFNAASRGAKKSINSRKNDGTKFQAITSTNFRKLKLIDKSFSNHLEDAQKNKIFFKSIFFKSSVPFQFFLLAFRGEI